MSDRVFVDELILEGNFGITGEEQRKTQRIQVDVSVGCDLSPAIESDDVKLTVNYAAIRKTIKAILASQPFFSLIETFGQKVIVALLENPRILDVTLSVRKLDVWEDGVPGIQLTRSKSA